MASGKLPGGIQDYKMNPGAHEFYPMFLDKSAGDQKKQVEVFNKVMALKAKYMKKCAEAEAEFYGKILQIIKTEVKIDPDKL